MTVYFIGAGPGDPELITVKGYKLIQSLPVIIYTGSLVPEDILKSARQDAEILNSASMTLPQIIEKIKAAHEQGLDVARVHTGDPSIYGSTAEQMRHLKQDGIPYEVIPGVSSFTAAAAALKQELTLPEVSQTVIVTRAEGRTPMPELEDLISLAKHQSTMCLFLSITLMTKIVRMLKPILGEDCPVAIVHKASCPEQIILKGTLSDIQAKVREAKITTQSIIIIGRVIDKEDFADSRLYAADFSHGYRKAETSL